MSLNPHNLLTALDPPSRDDRRWRCRYCHREGLYDELLEIACTFVYPPCPFCGQTPTCARDCDGIARALSGEDVYIAGLPPPKEKA